MLITAPAIVCSVKSHAEHGAIVRALTEQHGLIAGYVQGATSRTLRPVLIPGNEVRGEWRARVASQLPSLNVEPLHSRAHLLTEPLATAGIDWATALTAATLAEAHPYPTLYNALQGLLSAIEHAPAARGWAGAMARFEELLLIELGYGEKLVGASGSPEANVQTRQRLVTHLLGERQSNLLAARERLVDRLKRATG
jgi:DNA repair protein RecO (recombination protein O)